MATAVETSIAFLSGEGEMAGRFRAFDWNASELGSFDNWPQALRTVVRLMLNTRHPMYVFWGERHLCLYNDAYRQSIGPERHPGSIAMPGRDVWAEIWDIIGPQIEQVMAGRGATWHENALVPITRHGRLEDVYWTYSYSPIDDETAPSGIGGVLVLCTETTHAVEMEAQARRETLRNADFIATLSHEIRTPMNAVVGLARILAKSRPLTEKQQQWVKVLDDSAISLVELVNQVLDISRFESGSAELECIPFKFTDLISQITGMLGPAMTAKGLLFSGVDDCIDGRVFLGDPTRLRQILLNLCGNALKFTEAGEIQVGVACGPQARQEIDDVIITVSDTGIGIPEEKLPTIFDKYKQADETTARKFGGSGLGLAITKALVHAMGGAIEVSSIVGKGTTFTVSLPLRVLSEAEVN